jgi:predicted alpha/beta-hydrolase family hydrolase
VSGGLRTIALPDGSAISADVALPAAFQAGKTPAVLLAHGAGSDMANPFLVAMQRGLGAAGFVAVRFNFPYRERGRRVPDPAAVLERCWQSVLDTVTRDATLAPPWVAIGGRSLGGRMASHLAAAGAPIDALVLLGYPLHPPGRPDRLRTAHLAAIRVPALFVQGTRDAFGDDAALAPFAAAMPHATIHPIAEGDHGFRVPRRTGRTERAVWDDVLAAVVRFLRDAGAPLGG